ncbi:hypothetical protein PGT21_031777 [Puccinia graminis f. sp. tritici]|uniref:Uncharacterized protein n=1 Tax=Puccinia graminis f. sp. tritici TaxID=56615 RepID=A0A5B0P9D9_PUCGR|nr:hypothetical protein PGT21_031777 [Puccinia graminis f. sp. tritici]KAA1107929.1 hypothetical protein PGTUg99_012406 [Puccinia graminis f. sp. tritici]
MSHPVTFTCFHSVLILESVVFGMFSFPHPFQHSVSSSSQHALHWGTSKWSGQPILEAVTVAENLVPVVEYANLTTTRCVKFAIEPCFRAKSSPTLSSLRSRTMSAFKSSRILLILQPRTLPAFGRSPRKLCPVRDRGLDPPSGQVFTDCAKFAMEDSTRLTSMNPPASGTVLVDFASRAGTFPPSGTVLADFVKSARTWSSSQWRTLPAFAHIAGKVRAEYQGRDGRLWAQSSRTFSSSGPRSFFDRKLGRVRDDLSRLRVKVFLCELLTGGIVLARELGKTGEDCAQIRVLV